MDNGQIGNCRRIVELWRTLAAEARAVGANDLADEMDFHVAGGEECLTEHEPLSAAYEAVRCEHEAAAKAMAAAREAFLAGSLRQSAYQDQVQDLRILERRLYEAGGAVTTLLNRGIEQRDRIALEPFRRAEAEIESIANCCLSGFGNEWQAATRALDDAEAAKWEPIAIARALRAYPERERQSPDAHGIARFRECLELRATQRAYAVRAALPNETTMRWRPAEEQRDSRKI